MNKKIIFGFIILALTFITSLTFVSCSSEEDEYTENVDARLFKVYLEGSWVLMNESGYADFNEDGIKEFFNEKIQNDEKYSTVLTFDSNDNCKIATFCNGRYHTEYAKSYKYKVSRQEGANVLQIYGGKYCEYNKTFHIEVFQKNLLKMTYYGNCGYTTFTFKYCELQ